MPMPPRPRPGLIPRLGPRPRPRPRARLRPRAFAILLVGIVNSWINVYLYFVR